MKAYLAITGIIFAVVVALHTWRAVAEWNGVDSGFLIVAGLGVLALALAIWAWRLFTGLARQA